MNEFEYKLTRHIVLCLTIIIMGWKFSGRVEEWNYSHNLNLITDPTAQRLWAIKPYIGDINNQLQPEFLKSIVLARPVNREVLKELPVEVQKMVLDAEARLFPMNNGVPILPAPAPAPAPVKIVPIDFSKGAPESNRMVSVEYTNVMMTSSNSSGYAR